MKGKDTSLPLVPALFRRSLIVGSNSRAEAAAARYQELADTEKDGPRTVSRSIMKNKGLTPKRSKEVRNPRVKKRMRYEKAQKKIASQKPVYDRARASEGRGGDYGGEKTGISRNLVKSVKLGSK